MADHTLRLTATEIAARVRTGAVSPVDVVTEHLARIADVDDHVGAFQLVRADKALTEAQELSRRDLTELPLAGVPVAIKDNVDVAGEPTRHGSRGTSPDPIADDHTVVRRLRAAGAIVIGKTRVPEFCAWGWTDSSYGVTRSPWDRTRTSGGSSGGTGAAVAAAMVPLGQGTDAGGSIRLPSACCGVIGIKPGSGVVPSAPNDWYGLSEIGPLATTVDDLALGLAVMADQPDLATVRPPERRLRIAVSFAPQMPIGKLTSDYRAATQRVADLLADAGHAVVEADPPYGSSPMLTAVVRVYRGVADDATGIPLRMLERRTRPVVRAGRLFERIGLLGTGMRDRWRAKMAAFFNDFDLLLTPTLAAVPIAADGWSERNWLDNIRNASFCPYTGNWNVAGYPAAAVPTGHNGAGFPMSVELVAPTGHEAMVLSVAKWLEQAQPWTRHAPDASTAGLVHS